MYRYYAYTHGYRYSHMWIRGHVNNCNHVVGISLIYMKIGYVERYYKPFKA